MLVIRSVLLLLVSWLSFGRCDDDDDDDDLRFDIMDTMSVKCCECVPFYGCHNGSYINRALINEIQPMFGDKDGVINREYCPNPTDVCCRTPENLDNVKCSSFKTPKIPVIKNTQSCACFHWQTCPIDLIRTDNAGLISPFLQKIFLKSHSKCSEPTEVCCGLAEGDESESSHRTIAASSDGSFSSRISAEEKSKCCVAKELCTNNMIDTTGAGILEPRTHKCSDSSEVYCCSSVAIKFLPELIFASLIMVMIARY